ncbi:MAG: hypothetical protein M5U08_18835 [Burkholderiales bacterium]|nr:hypothetical protein [Burkholderiales bacterium]
MLSIAAAIVFAMTSSAALACSGAKAKSADGLQGSGASTTLEMRGG